MCHWIQPSSLSSLLSPFSTGGIVQKASVRSACQPCQWPNAGQPYQHLFCTLLTQYCSRVSWVQIPPKAALPFSSKERVVLGVVDLFALPLPSYLILLLTHVQVSDNFALIHATVAVWVDVQSVWQAAEEGGISGAVQEGEDVQWGSLWVGRLQVCLWVYSCSGGLSCAALCKVVGGMLLQKSISWNLFSSLFLCLSVCLSVSREVVQELTDEYIASTRADYISRGSAKVRTISLFTSLMCSSVFFWCTVYRLRELPSHDTWHWIVVHWLHVLIVLYTVHIVI